MLFLIFGVVFVLPPLMYPWCGVLGAGFIVRPLNFMMAKPETPVLFTDEHFLEDYKVGYNTDNKRIYKTSNDIILVMLLKILPDHALI